MQKGSSITKKVLYIGFPVKALQKGSRFPSKALQKGSIYRFPSNYRHCKKVLGFPRHCKKVLCFPVRLQKGSIGFPVRHCKKVLYRFPSKALQKGSRFPSKALQKGSMFSSKELQKGSMFSSKELQKGSIGFPVIILTAKRF